MKKIFSIVSLVAILFGLTGCYEDKGNYDYKNLPKPLISNIESKQYVYIGEKLVIEPKIDFSENQPTIKNIAYSWVVDAKEISTEQNLDWTVNLTAGTRIFASFTVTDLDNDVSTIKKFEIYPETMFKSGWVVLSELDGKGHLCYQRLDDVFYKDIYGMINDGEELSSKPTKLREHWLPYSGEIGQINVICSGGPNYSVELDGSSFSKIIYNKQEFISEKEPANFAPINAWYVSGYDMLLNTDGKIYTRQITSGWDAVYQEGSFVDVPAYGDYQLTQWSMRGSYVYDNEIISYDKANKRYVIITDGVINSINTNKDKEKAFVVENMTKEVIAGGVNSIETPEDYFVTILKDINSSKYYMHRFFMYGYRAPRSFYSISETEIADGGLITDNSKIAVSLSRPYVFFTNGSVLYRYNIDANEIPEKIMDYGKTIQAIALNTNSTTMGMVIGDGDSGNDFITVDVSLKGEGKILTEQKGVCGKGIDILYKIGDQWLYE